MLKKLIPIAAAIAASRLGHKQASGPKSGSNAGDMTSGSGQKAGMSSTFGAMASAFLAEKFLPARTTILGKALAAALPMTVARYLKG